MTDFDLLDVDAQDEGELVIRHPKTLDLDDLFRNAQKRT